MSAPTLYSISREYQVIDQLLAEAEEAGQDLSSPEVAEIVTRWWLALDGDLQAKVERCIPVILEQKALSKSAKAEAARLAAYSKARAARADRIGDAVHAALIAAGKTRVETRLGAACVEGDGGVAPLLLNDGVDPDEVAAQWPDLVRVTTAIDNDAVRRLLASGQPLPFAALGERGTHLKIR